MTQVLAEQAFGHALMLHALGLPDEAWDPARRPVSTRNYFAADPESDDDLALALMADMGIVRLYKKPGPIFPYNFYTVTDAGKARIRDACGPFDEAA